MAERRSVVETIGDTPIVELRRIVPRGSARVLAKLDSANPTGSMKDRMARAMVERAAADGRLAPGGTIVEYTAGTTGVSLALVGGQPDPARMMSSQGLGGRCRLRPKLAIKSEISVYKIGT